MDLQQKRAAHTILHSLKGARIHILLALFIEARPTAQDILATIVPYSERTIRADLKFLEHQGYIERVHYRAWQLPNRNQLPLPGFEFLPGPSSLQAETANSAASAHVHTTTTTTLNKSNKNIVSSSTVPPETAEFAVSAELKAVLDELRIGGEAILAEYWPRIAACEWVTPRYLRATAARINERDDAYRNAGFFVHCVLAHDPEPEEWHECCNGLGGHRPNCAQRYLQGPYADLVEH